MIRPDGLGNVINSIPSNIFTTSNLSKIGQVIGMVFAADAQNEDTGYALTPNEITSFLSQERFEVEKICTESCAKTS